MKFLTGFTLIELALVTLIILALVGLSAPLFKNTFSDLAAKETALNISKLISYGQEKAIIEKKNFKISIDRQKLRYQLFEMDLSAEPHVYKPAQGRFGRPFAPSQGVFLKCQKDAIIFYPDGRSDEADIDIINSREEGYTITVKGFGSRAEVRPFKK